MVINILVRILLITGIFPPEIGGPASYIPRLGKALAGQHEVEVLTLGEESQEDAEYPFVVHRVSTVGSVWNRRRRTVQLMNELMSLSDVALVNGLFFEAGWVASGSPTPAVAKVVGDTVWERARGSQASHRSLDEFQQNQGSLKWRMFHRLQAWCFRQFSEIFTPSLYLADIVRSWGVDSERVSVIPNAVELQTPILTEPQVDLVTVARLVPWKGLMELIDLAAENQWSLSIVGDGPMRSELAHQIKSRGSQDIELRGAVPQEHVAAEIRRGRVFVLNSSYEGLPHIVLEAKAAGVPVVATAAGGTPETINDGEDGRLVPVGKARKLEQVLKELLNDGCVRKTLSHAGLSQLKKDFSFQEMVKDTEDLLMKTSAISG